MGEQKKYGGLANRSGRAQVRKRKGTRGQNGSGQGNHSGGQARSAVFFVVGREDVVLG